MIEGSCPKIWRKTGGSFSVISARAAVFSSPCVSATAEIISLVVDDAPSLPQIERKVESV